MSWRYELTRHARRDIRDLDVQARRRVFEALDKYVAQRHANVIKIQGAKDQWRLRVGDLADKVPSGLEGPNHRCARCAAQA